MLSFKRRRLTIRTMEEADVDEYYLQVSSPEEKRNKAQVKRTARECKNSKSDERLLLVATEIGTNKIIGTIITKKLATGTIRVQISIPNENKKWAYGTEVIDQFVKICKEESFFKEIKFLVLDAENPISKKYMEGKGITSPYINVA